MSRILLVDDSEAIRLLLNHFLTQHGYELVSAKSVEEALQSIKQQTPDLILLDVQLPDMTGFEFCRLLRSQTPTRYVPIIMVAASANTAKDKVEGLQSGADDFLQKPLELDELLERIRAVMRRSANRSTPDLQRGSSILPDTPSPKTRALTTKQAIVYALCSPFSITGDLPSISLLFLLSMTLLLAFGLSLSSDLAFRPLMVCLFALFTWGFLVSVLIVSCSIAGIPLHWKEGSRLLSLASFPLLFKFTGGVLLAATTSLTPFLFSAGPNLFLKAAPFWLYRLDIYEVWSVILLWILVRKRPGASPVKTSSIVLLVWMAGFFLLFFIHQMRGQL